MKNKKAPPHLFVFFILIVFISWLYSFHTNSLQDMPDSRTVQTAAHIGQKSSPPVSPETNFKLVSLRKLNPGAEAILPQGNVSKVKLNTVTTTPKILKLLDNNQSGIILTFDDNTVDEWSSFLAFNKEYKAKATFYVCNFNNFTSNQIMKLRNLQNAGNEIAYHTLNHLNALQLIKEKSLNYYIQTEIFPGVAMMEEEGFHVKNFAYPYGAGNRELDNELLKYFDTVRYTFDSGKNEKISNIRSIYIQNNKTSVREQRVLHAVGIDNAYEYDLTEIFQGIDHAYNSNQLIILYAHGISDKPDNYGTNPEKLRAIIQYAYDRGMKFYTVSDLEKLVEN